MSRLSQAVIIPVLACVIFSGPQSTPNAPNSVGNSAHLPVGAALVGVLSTNLDTRHSRLGDQVEVEVTQDIQVGGLVMLARGSHVTGQITQVNAFSKGDQNAKLEIVFHTVTPKHGEKISTYLIIAALAAQPDPSAPASVFAGADPAGEHTGVAGKPDGSLHRRKPESRGIIGLEGFTLAPMAKKNPPTSVLHSASQNIHLQKGTEIVLVVIAQ